MLLLEDNYKHFMLSNPINGRAWTFQEALLSPRKLCYSRDMMHWYCRSAQRFDGDWKKKDRLYATDKYDWTIDNGKDARLFHRSLAGCVLLMFSHIRVSHSHTYCIHRSHSMS